MKVMRFYLSGIFFVLILQNGMGQYQYAPGKKYIIRSLEKGDVTCVTQIRIDSSMVAFVKFSKEKSLATDKSTFVVLAPTGEVTAKLSTTFNADEVKTITEMTDIMINVPKMGYSYFFFPHGNKQAYPIKNALAVEGNEIKKQVLKKQLLLTEEPSEASQLVISCDQPGDLHTSFIRNGEAFEFYSTGVLIKASKVIFE